MLLAGVFESLVNGIANAISIAIGKGRGVGWISSIGSCQELLEVAVVSCEKKKKNKFL